jgi:hypothetical protein
LAGANPEGFARGRPPRKIEGLPAGKPFARDRLSEGTRNYPGLVVIQRKSVIRPRGGRVPVTAGPRLIEFAGPERVRSLLLAPNARAVRQRKTQAIVAIVLDCYGDDSRLHTRGGNPQKLSHNAETAENPPRVWTFKKLEQV